MPAEERSEDQVLEHIEGLIARMTVEEKARQVTQYFYFAIPEGGAPVPQLAGQAAAIEVVLRQGGAGSLLMVTDPVEVNRLQRLAIEGDRLGIPALFGFDVIHGLRTILPVPIAMAASWDLDAIAAGQAVAARESRAVGIRWVFSPMVDIARDPRWGRIVETAGEDPYLGAAVAAAQVRGYQGDGVLGREKVIAGPKHLAGYGAALGGRDYDEVDLSDSELWNTYLPPFKAAIDAGARNIMSAYMPLNGVPATGNAWLLTEVLREQWGFQGFVVSDANAVQSLVRHGFAADLADAGARALNAGVDMEMAAFAPAFDHLPAAVASGAVSEATLDAAVRRILVAKADVGLFDDPFVDPEAATAILNDPAHREVARDLAVRSAVLLRNEGATLPLRAGELASIAVIGPLADSRRDTIGSWALDFDLEETVTVLAGIRERAGDGIDVRYARGISVDQRGTPSPTDLFPGNRPEDPEGFDADAEFARAVETAGSSDVAIVVLGEYQSMSGEAASRATLDLPGRQLELLKAVVATATPTVLVLMNGRPLDLRWAAEHVPAILDIWYPGTRGGTATADLLFGDREPSGRLPFTWPRSAGQVPIISSHLISHDADNQGLRYWDEPSTPLFPFGFGLGYASVTYNGIAVDREQVGVEDSVKVSARVVNTSDRDAVEIVQLYLHQRHGSAARPARQLRGFRRVEVAAGATETVEFTVGPDERRYWSAATRGWVNERSTFDVWVGRDVTATASTSFRVG